MSFKPQTRNQMCSLFFGALFSTVLILTACQKQEIQIDENFVNLYVDLQLATLGNHNNLKRAEQSRQVILKQYSMTRDQYRQELEKVMNQPANWETFQAAVLERIGEIEKLHKGE